MTLDRRKFVLGGSAAMLTLSIAPSAFAKAGPVTAQVSGVQHFNAGGAVVSAVSDGYLDIDGSLFPAAGKEELAATLKRAFADTHSSVRSSVNAFVARLPDRTVLIDGGAGNALGPTAGRLLANLTAAGVAPEEVDVIAATHLHPDHIGGVVTPEGKAVFPNATLLVHEEDVAFWRDDTARANAPDAVKAFFDLARSALEAYKGRTEIFAKDGEVVSGLSATLLPGHTPGHCGFTVGSGAEALLVWGDIVHAPALQFDRPDWSINFDVDMEMAKQTRQRVFEQVASEGTRVAGMHLQFPGIGHVAKDGDGFGFVPAQWDYDLTDGK